MILYHPVSLRLGNISITIQCFPHIDFTWAGRPGILTAAQVYLVTHFYFYYYYYHLLHFFLPARDNETIRDRLTSWKSPLARRVSHCSFCVLRNCPHSHRQALSLYLWRDATISTTRCHQLPHLTHKSATLAQYLATFRPFWRLFSTQKVHTDKPSDFFEKTLAIVQLEDVSSTAPRARALTLPAQCRLSLRLFCAASSRETELSVRHNAAKSSVNHLQNSVSKHLSLTDCLDF